MPLRTTYEYSNPKVSASLQAVLAEAMQTEDDIDITDQSNYASMMKQRLDRITRRNVGSEGSSGSGISVACATSNGIPPSSSSSSGANGVTSRARSSIYNRGMSAAPTFGAHSGVTATKKAPPASAATFPKARGLIPK